MTWWKRLVNRGRLEAELDSELQDHVARHAADLEARGVAPAEARRQALATLGGLDPTKEYCRDARGTRWLEDAVQDVRYAVRTLARTPGYVAAAVLSLALGIGANTAIFSLVNGLLLRVIPVTEPDRLVRLDHGSWTNPIWEQIRDRHADQLPQTAAYSDDQFDLARGGPSDRVEGLWTSGRFFEVLGVPAILGRTYGASDDRRGGGPDGPVAVISHAFWQRRFGGAADVIGRTITLDRQSVTIVGVTPAGFLGPGLGRSFDIAVPLGIEPLLHGHYGAQSWLDGRSTWWLEIVSRLRPGQSVEDATRALRGVQPQIRAATLPERWPPAILKQYLEDPLTFTPIAAGDSYLRDRYRQPLFTLMGAVALVLLIACANLANLALARATARRHELSLRRALGASRWRLVRQLLVESVLLAGAGALVGLVFAQWTSRLLVGQLSTYRETIVLDLALDWRVLAFTAGTAVATVLLFGLVPALRAGGADPADALAEQGRGGVAVSRRRFGGPLVVAQVALSLVLLVAAGLFVRTFTTLATLDLGFDRDPVLLVTLDAGHSSVPMAARAGLYARVRDAAAAVPGVARASISSLSPLSGMGWNDVVEVPDAPRPGASDRELVSWFNAVSPGWFATLGAPIRVGRDFDARDRPGAPLAAIVNEAFAAKRLPPGNPLGRQLRLTMHDVGEADKVFTVVGVAGNMPYNKIQQATEPIVFVVMEQNQDEHMPPAVLNVRAAGGQAPDLLVRSLTAAITGVDRDLALTFRPLRDQINAALVRERIMALLSGFFGGLALLLAAIGLYGVASYSVSLRRTEIGIRMALGANALNVQRAVLARVAVLVGIGVALGAAASYWSSRLVASLLFGLAPGDVPTIAGAALLLVAVAIVAAWLPARRAARIDPAVVLRQS